MNALLSIKPEFAEKILAGEKQYEFRRTTFRDAESVDCVYLYASSPVKQIVGAFTIQRVVEATPTELWELFGDQSGIEKRERFIDYFEGVETGYAIETDAVHRFRSPIDPNEMFDEFVPPVSFHYLDRHAESRLQQQFPESMKNPRTTELPQFTSD